MLHWASHRQKAVKYHELLDLLCGEYLEQDQQRQGDDRVQELLLGIFAPEGVAFYEAVLLQHLAVVVAEVREVQGGEEELKYGDCYNYSWPWLKNCFRDSPNQPLQSHLL